MAIAAFKYFADLDGQTTELTGLHGMKNAEFASRFPGIKGRRFDGYAMLVGCPASGGDDRFKVILPATRCIQYKRQPSKHECDTRCTHAKGRTMTCECSCGGANHGKAG